MAARHLQHIEQDVRGVEVGSTSTLAAPVQRRCPAGLYCARPRTAPRRRAFRRRIRRSGRRRRTGRGPAHLAAPRRACCCRTSSATGRPPSAAGRSACSSSTAMLRQCRRAGPAVGSSLTKVSAMKSVRCSSISAFSVAKSGAPGFRPMQVAHVLQVARRSGPPGRRSWRRRRPGGSSARRSSVLERRTIDLSRLGRDTPLRPHELVVGLPVLVEAAVVLGVDQRRRRVPRLDAQAGALDARGDDLGAADQRWACTRPSSSAT